MFTKTTPGLTPSQDREYRDLKAQLYEKMLEEAILIHSERGASTRDLTAYLERVRDERAPGGPFLRGLGATLVENHAKIAEMVDRGEVRRFSLPVEIGGHVVDRPTLAITEAGRMRLPQLKLEIEVLGESFSPLEEQRYSVPSKKDGWIDLARAFFGGDR